MIQPRDYQIAAHNAVIDWWKKSIEPCVVEAPTGSGKSVIVAMLAKSLYDLSGGRRVLCLAPSRELVSQNAEKYELLGEKCSIYSASISKSLRHQVIFATEGTFKSVAKRLGHEFAGVILDEAHRIAPTVKKIISDMREGNPNLRVCGLSATPYRTLWGFIFAKDIDGNPISEFQTKDPYFTQLVYTLNARDLINRGYLTNPVVGEIHAEGYETSNLEIGKNGQFTPSSLDRAFAGWGRKTANIVADVVAQSRNRKGVMIFAATTKHAEEVMASLPPELSALVTGDTHDSERKSVVARFKAQKLKYVVSVNTMTTGVDFTHVDVVAILRDTESVSLLQQIIGRGLRLHEGKKDCLILCYSDAINRHCPDGDLFRPEIRAPYQGKGEAFIECVCPECNATNHFAARKNDAGLEVNHIGYFVDLDGNEIIDAVTGKPMPAHHGRRCRNLLPAKGGTLEPCSYYWSCKICPVCEADNDIAARYCRSCREELIDPAKKLVEIHTKAKKDPTIVQCDEVLNMDVVDTLSRAGKPMLRVTFTTPYRVFTVYFQKEAQNQWAADQYHRFLAVGTPRTVRFVKDGDFWRIKGYNQKTDDELLQERLAE